MLSRVLKTSLRARQLRPLHTTPYLHASSSGHSADSYFKDIDPNPPKDSSIHRVDPSSDKVQKPHEPPSGEWSQAGIKTGEYSTVNKEEPYDVSKGEHGETAGDKLRYGGKEKYGKDKAGETSHPGEGPEGTESGGRKPEGK